jgi:hypothetical protein
MVPMMMVTVVVLLVVMVLAVLLVMLALFMTLGRRRAGESLRLNLLLLGELSNLLIGGRFG